MVNLKNTTPSFQDKIEKIIPKQVNAKLANKPDNKTFITGFAKGIAKENKIAQKETTPEKVIATPEIIKPIIADKATPQNDII